MVLAYVYNFNIIDLLEQLLQRSECSGVPERCNELFGRDFYKKSNIDTNPAHTVTVHQCSEKIAVLIVLLSLSII